jgi:hypothetical protein
MSLFIGFLNPFEMIPENFESCAFKFKTILLLHFVDRQGLQLHGGYFTHESSFPLKKYFSTSGFPVS